MIPKRVAGKIRQQKNHSGNFDFFQKGTLGKYYKHRNSAYLIGTEPFLSTLQEVLFHQALNISSCWLDFFHILKNYHPMQKMMSLVIGVYKFCSRIFTFDIFGIFCTII